MINFFKRVLVFFSELVQSDKKVQTASEMPTKVEYPKPDSELLFKVSSEDKKPDLDKKSNNGPKKAAPKKSPTGKAAPKKSTGKKKRYYGKKAVPKKSN